MSLDEEARRVLGGPLLRFLGARFDGWVEGTSRVSLTAIAETLNANDRLHGGTLCTLLDVTAYLALLPSLDPAQTAVTHNMNVSFFGPSSLGDELLFEAHVVHRGRTLAFVQSEARVGDKRIATATVCKSLVVLR
ncbi:MAG TPA: PaaI family thioesterase [Polyangiaceae bacterium]|nr:PaaI family thioesterase [Polyangiaceae bacterium]